MQNIILASKSPRRSEILTRLGVEYAIQESGFDESSIACENPRELVEELALQKALAISSEEDALVIGGDTVVSLPAQAGMNGEILGKAHSEDEAREILLKLIGKSHEVVTGVAVVDSLTGERAVGSAVGEVRFRDVSEQELTQYITDGKWKGFAGCYAIQGGAKEWVMEQTGVFSAIIGMPVVLTAQLLEEMGVVIEVDPKQVEIEIIGEKIGLEE
jgi:septum formation protein